MNPITVFHFSMCGLIIHASVILAFSEGYAFPTAVTIPIALVAYFVSEHRPRFQLSLKWANLLGLLAFSVVLCEFVIGDIEGKLLSFAHLLVYLTWIIVFQEKKSRQYWLLFALTALQVAVSAVLTKEGELGALLVAFLFVAVWTLSLFSLIKTAEQFKTRRHWAVLAAGPGTSGRLTAIQFGDDNPNGSHSLDSKVSHSVSSLQIEQTQGLIDLRFLRSTLVTSVPALIVGAVIFVLIPRQYWNEDFYAFRGGTVDTSSDPLTGFTNRVRLGELGEILQSNEPVLEVRIFDDSKEEPQIDIDKFAQDLGYDEPLFRGIVLGKYVNGSWSVGSVAGREPQMASGKGKPEMIRQEYRMQPIGHNFIFAIHPVRYGEIAHQFDDVFRQSTTTVLRRSSIISKDEELSYTVWTHKEDIVRIQLFETPTVLKFDPVRQKALESYILLPKHQLERLKQLAREKAGNAKNGRPAPQRLIELYAELRRLNGNQEDRAKKDLDADRALIRDQIEDLKVTIAQRFVDYFRKSGLFKYSLKAKVIDTSIDPVEDFLFNRKEGHCEYYASALALMLRAVGIQSRLVSGFKGGDTNPITKQFIVQQRHAHAWVEAWIGDRWRVLEATPAEREESVESMGTTITVWSDVSQMFAELWSSNILGMNKEQQNEVIYKPLSRRVKSAWQSIRDGFSGASPSGIVAFLTTPSRWFGFQGFLFLFIVLLILMLARRIVRRLPRLVLTRKQHRSMVKKRNRIRIDFYERFQKILAIRGWVRATAQTQREFAQFVEGRLAPQLSPVGLNACPLEVVDLFYRIRFGSDELDNREVENIEDQLNRLEQCLADGPEKGAASGP